MGLRVLVVEDEDDIRDLMALILEDAGYTVLKAANGQEALTQITSQSFELVILDVVLPDVSGWEVCARLKAAPFTQCVPVIICTAYAETHGPGRFECSGAEFLLPKPFEKDDLLSAIHILTAGSQLVA